MALTKVLLILLVLFISKSFEKESLKDFPEECFTATEIDDSTREFDNYLIPTSTEDDLLLRKGWYRFTGRSANSLKQGLGGPLPGNKDNAPNFCGTVYPGMLMGTHPTVEEGITAMMVCFRNRYCFYEKFKACQCKSKKRIYVRNCRRHYIYWLVPTSRRERYCTSQTWLTKPIISSNISDALECGQYETVRDPTRIWNSPSGIIPETAEGWVRFDAVSGGEVASRCNLKNDHIPESTRPCGAKFRGWMIDSHPSLLEGRINRRVCFSYTDECTCEFFTNIAVRNCGSYFVYHLRKPPINGARYCGAEAGSHAAINDVKKPRFETKNICNVSKTVYNIDRLWSNTNPTITKCDANLYGAYKFGSPDIPLVIKERCNKTDMLVIHHRCATRYQGFMEGRHPTVNEGYVERIICFQSSLVPCECHFTTVIGVQNCGDSYAYDLKGVPMCDARFCMVVNKNTDIVVDDFSESMYGIPSNYKPRVAPLKEDSENVTYEDFSLTAVLLSVVLLLLCVLLIIVVLLVLCIVRPMYNEKRKGPEPVHL